MMQQALAIIDAVVEGTDLCKYCRIIGGWPGAKEGDHEDDKSVKRRPMVLTVWIPRSKSGTRCTAHHIMRPTD
jgi:hypothetical protein